MENYKALGYAAIHCIELFVCTVYLCVCVCVSVVCASVCSVVSCVIVASKRL